VSAARKLGARSIFIRDVALAVLRDGEWHGREDIAKACGLTRGPAEREYVTNQLRAMVREELIERCEAGYGAAKLYRRASGHDVADDDLRQIIDSLGLGAAS
jgi:hypothetical protein